MKLRAWWVIVGLALLARLMVALAILPDPQRVVLASDTRQYLELAQSIIETGRFGQWEGGVFTPDALRTPGYPLLIAPLFLFANPPLIPLVIVQTLIGTLVTAGTMLLAQRMFYDRRVSLAAGLLYALAPISAVMVGFGYSETLFAAWMVGAGIVVWIGLERNQPLLSGIGGAAYGLATLTRPIGLLLLPLLVLSVVLFSTQRRRDAETQRAIASFSAPSRLCASALLKHSALLTLGFSLLVGGWMARNYAYFGQFSLSSVSDLNLYYYNAASLEAHRLDIPLDEARSQLAARLQPDPDDRWPFAAEGALARQVILAHPIQFVWFNGIDALNGLRPGFSFMLRLFGQDEAASDPIEVFMRGDGAAILATMRGQNGVIVMLELYMLLHLLLLIVLAGIGLMILIIQRRWAAVVLLGLIPALLMYLPGLASNARFRAPIEPLLAIAAGFCISALIDWIRPRRSLAPNSDVRTQV